MLPQLKLLPKPAQIALALLITIMGAAMVSEGASTIFGLESLNPFVSMLAGLCLMIVATMFLMR